LAASRVGGLSAVEDLPLDWESFVEDSGSISWGPCTKGQVRISSKNEAKSESDIIIGSAYGELASSTFGRGRGNRRLGCRIIDLDPTWILADDLLSLPLKRWSYGGFAFSSPSHR
jgi:hypothetical protein